MRLIIINKKALLLFFIVLVLIILTIIVTLVYNRVEETFNPDVYYQGNTDEKILAFACNVDWGNEYIPKMLKIFEDNNIKITFL